MTPFASIIVLSRDQFESDTRPCLTSLLADSFNRQAQIIIVDNGSDYETQVGITAYEQLENVTVIRNDRDIGFSCANNIGIESALGEVIVLLNNDTIVPSGAIRRLAELLEQHPDWGAVGPVSNAVGNEQAIFFEEKSPQGILSAAEQWSRHANNSFIATKQLSFFAVALPRRTIDDIGVLDEHFSPFYYEDADYCIRINQAGKAMMIAEEVFVYHRGSATTSKQPERTKRIMRVNKQKLIEKHGAVELLHKRDANLRSLNSYLHEAAKCSGDSAEAVRYRFDNRFKLGEAERPRGFIKRLLYQKRLNDVLTRWNSLVVNS